MPISTAALDSDKGAAAGKVVAAAQFDHNPFLMKGQGEVEAHLKLTLEAVEPADPPSKLNVKR